MDPILPLRQRRRFSRTMAAALLASLLVLAPPRLLPDSAPSQGIASVALASPGPRETGGDGALLNEILPAPRERFESEWVELYNPGEEVASVGGWTLDDIEGGGSRPYRIPEGAEVPPRGYLVLSGTTTGVRLNNDGDTLRLLDETGALVDSFSYESTEYDVSFARMPDGGAEWKSSRQPTPGGPNPAPSSGASRGLLITQVYYHAYPGAADEFVALTNPSPDIPVELDGWSVTDGDSSALLPEGAELPPGGTIFLTGSASDFLRDMGRLPDFEAQSTTPSVGRVGVEGSWPSLSNEGGWVALRDPTGESIDVYAWGRAYGGEGWTGDASPALGAGRVARRALGPAGEWLDTNSSLDWPVSRATIVGRTDFPPASFEASEVVSFTSPDCSFDVLSGELAGARDTILLALYQLESLEMASLLEAALERGVMVRILLEGQPVAGLTDQERALARALHQSGAEVLFMAGNASAGSGGRYAYMHAKYCVIDNETSIVMSENWSPSGVPRDPSYGNRGWGVVVRSRGLAAHLSELFLQDSNPAMRDVHPYSPGGGVFGPPPEGSEPNASAPKGSYAPRFAPARHGGTRVSTVLSPDNSLAPNASVLGLIESASRSLLIELLSCSPDWGESGPNPYLEAVVSAARRGVRVRALLDGSYLNPSESGRDNSEVVNRLNYIAAKEGLDMEARLAGMRGVSTLHNKGLVADGERVLVSSLNWGRTSALENREVGLIVEGVGPASYFEAVFMTDWNLTVGGGGGEGGGGGGPEEGPGACLPLAVVAALATLALFVAAGRRRGRLRY
ncbi:MAG: phospholipase D-like domain-containing protein [Thermoplasmatota archaeon]